MFNPAVGIGAGVLVGCAPAIKPHQGAAGEIRESTAAFELRSERGIAELRRHIPIISIHTLIDKIVLASELEDYDGVNGKPAPGQAGAAPVVAGAVGAVHRPVVLADHVDAICTHKRGNGGARQRQRARQHRAPCTAFPLPSCCPALSIKTCRY